MIRPFVLLTSLALAGCTATLALPVYQTVSTEDFTGSARVEDFTYSPRPGIAQNEIRDTNAGRKLVTEPVGSYFANAMRRELRQAGVTLRDGACTLVGTINDFAAETLGFQITHITDVTYRLMRPDGSLLLEQRVTVNFKTTKTRSAELLMSGITRSVSDNMAIFLKNPEFRRNLEAECPGRVAPRRASPPVRQPS